MLIKHKKEIIHKNILYIIESDPYETYEIFCTRVNFISAKIDEHNSISEVIMESKLFRNKILYGAIY